MANTPTRAGYLAGAAAIAIIASLAAPHTAYAAIRCDGPYQIIKGVGLHASPYCENTYLAHVANSRGIPVSAKAVRNNPSVKAEVCHAIGFDSRVRNICAGYLPEGRHRF